MNSSSPLRDLPLPGHYDAEQVGQVWRVPYEERAVQALEWARRHDLSSAGADEYKINLIAIDVQNTFCLPDFELFVAGQSGQGAVEDNRRLSAFIYRNLANLTRITATLDTHRAIQIFHSIFLTDEDGTHPDPYTIVTAEDVQAGRWRFNPAVADSLEVQEEFGQKHLAHYARVLENREKFNLTVWPYHAMFGGIGHALVAAVEEAIFFHTIARNSQAELIVKGENPFTEHYSALGPEVLEGPSGEKLGEKSKRFLNKVREFDAVVIAGQAKSHCVAWTISDLLDDIQSTDPELAQKVYLLEDCTSPVVVPGADYSAEADRAFERFAEAGMQVVDSTESIASWPGTPGRQPAG